MNSGIEMLCNRVLGALFNGGYQGLLLTGLIWLGLKIIRRSNAATRHAVALVTLVIVALLPIVHFVLPDADRLVFWRPTESSERHWEFASDVAGLNLETLVVGTEIATPVEGASNDRTELNGTMKLDVGEQPVTESIEDLPLPGIFFTSSTLLATTWEVASEFLSITAEWWRLPIPSLIGVGLVALWIALAAARIGNLAWQYWMLRRLKYSGGSAPENVCVLFKGLRAGLRMKRKPAIVICSEAVAPMVAGFRHPAVSLLPVAVLRDAGRLQLEQILRHELAHVARADDWANLVQQIIKGILFFHPGVWWLSKRLTIEREIACDDHVLTAPGTPQAYALFLTEFARRTQCRDWVAAPAAWSKRSQLTERISMILDSKRNSSPRLARAKAASLAAVAALLAVWGLRSGPRVALAAEQPAPKLPALEVSQEAQNLTEVHPDSQAKVIVSDVAEPPEEPAGITVTSTLQPKPGSPPEPPTPPSSSFTLTAPVPVNAPTPLPPAVVRSVSKRKEHTDTSIEQRLDRLERMVETLLARDREKRKTDATKDFSFNYKMQKDLFDGDSAVRWKSGTPNGEDMAKLKDFAKHQAEIAAKDAQRAAREMDKTRQEIAQVGENSRSGRATKQFDDNRDQFEVERQQLEAQRKVLEKQMHALEKQLDRLNQEQVKVQHSDDEHEKRINRLKPQPR